MSNHCQLAHSIEVSLPCAVFSSLGYHLREPDVVSLEAGAWTQLLVLLFT